MEDNRSNNWKWWALVAALGFLHIVVLMWVDMQVFLNYHGPRSRPIGAPTQPPWVYFAFMNTFGFPASIVFRFVHPGLHDAVYGYSMLLLTGFLWGCLWAEPFRRRYGWKPWRFSTRDLLLITTAAAIVLGLIAMLKSQT